MYDDDDDDDANKALPEGSIEDIPELLVPPTDYPYSVLESRLMELFDLSDYERVEQPTSLLWYAFLSRLPPDIRVHCVPFVGVETLAGVARRADAQFRARPRPAATTSLQCSARACQVW